MAKMGRPSKFSLSLGREICARLSEGESLRSICRDEDMPDKTTVIRWLFNENFDDYQDIKDFRTQYEQARITQMHMLAEELLDIADDGTNDYMMRESKSGDEYEVTNAENIQRSRLRVDTRKWLLSKVLPKVYGDKVVQEITGKDGGPIETQDTTEIEAARAIAYALEKGRRSLEESETCH
jgi:hypothetical protein